MDDPVIFLEHPSTIRWEDGLVHIEDRSGGAEFHRVMSIHTLMENHRSVEKIINKWLAEQGTNISRLRGETVDS